MPRPAPRGRLSIGRDSSNALTLLRERVDARMPTTTRRRPVGERRICDPTNPTVLSADPDGPAVRVVVIVPRHGVSIPRGDLRRRRRRGRGRASPGGRCRTRAADARARSTSCRTAAGPRARRRGRSGSRAAQDSGGVEGDVPTAAAEPARATPQTGRRKRRARGVGDDRDHAPLRSGLDDDVRHARDAERLDDRRDPGRHIVLELLVPLSGPSHARGRR